MNSLCQCEEPEGRRSNLNRICCSFRDCFAALAMTLVFLLWGCGKAVADKTVHIQVDKGKELYLSYGCALCHGWEGHGDGINAQKFDPPPTNFHNPKAFLHGNDGDSIRRSIQYGIKEDNSIMPAFEDIPPEEIEEIINYLQSFQNVGAGSKPARTGANL